LLAGFKKKPRKTKESEKNKQKTKKKNEEREKNGGKPASKDQKMAVKERGT